MEMTSMSGLQDSEPVGEANFPYSEPVSPEENNIAASLEDDELNKIADTCLKDFNDDLESRTDWEDMHAKWLELYYQRDRSQTPPWDGASEECAPILAEAVNQFQSRTYRAFFPNRYFIDAIPVGRPTKQARERAERIGKHMSFQLSVMDRTYKPNKSQMFLAVALHGSDFTKTYYSPIRRRNVIERVRAMDLVVPYGVGPRRLEEIERKTQVKWMTLNQTRILERDGWFLDEGEPYNDSEGSQIQDVADDAEGVTRSNSYDGLDGQCCILEQHRLLDLDDDGIGEPYIVWVDRQSKKVLRIQIRYEVDKSGLPLDNKEPIEMFTHYQFLPNPDGFYGLGFGHLLGHSNKAVNKLLRMFIDANELSTVGNMGGLVSESLGLPGDEFDISLGRFDKLPRSVEDIRKHVFQWQFPQPSQQTLQMIQEITTASQRLSANTDILSGQPDKVYQPHAMLAMIEQGLQLFSSVQEFLGVSMEDELQKIYRLNAKHLDENPYFQFGDEQIEVTKEDYMDDFRVMPIFDPKYATRSQKLAKAQAEYDFVTQNPLMGQNPTALYLASRGVLEALDTENIDAILPEPNVPQPARIDDQNLENAYFMMPPVKRPLFEVFPDQDHIAHIQKIDQFIAYLDGASPLDIPNVPGGDPQVSRLLVSMSNEQKQELIANLLSHRAQHAAFMFGQLNGVMDEQGNPIESGQPGARGMAQPSSDQGALEQLIGSIQSMGGAGNMPAGRDALPSGANQDF